MAFLFDVSNGQVGNIVALGVGNCRGPSYGEYGGPNLTFSGELSWPLTANREYRRHFDKTATFPPPLLEDHWPDRCRRGAGRFGSGLYGHLDVRRRDAGQPALRRHPAAPEHPLGLRRPTRQDSRPRPGAGNPAGTEGDAASRHRGRRHGAGAGVRAPGQPAAVRRPGVPG